MTSVTSSPLNALVGYYARLEADPSPREAVTGFGFSREKIHFQIVLEPDGRLVSVDDLRERGERGKPIPRLLLVPDGGGRSGTALRPFFCWDNTGYALGRDNKGNPERAAEMFAAFRSFHLSFREALRIDEGFHALCLFLGDWNPEKAEALLNWSEVAGLSVVFRLRGREGFVHESAPVKEAWLNSLGNDGENEKEVRGISLISGQEEGIARLHPLIRGVAGANTMGAAIVSFNLDAFESYRKSQSYNAPVGVHDAFRYTTALNRLLADDCRRVRIGDATVVFWSDRAEGAGAEEVFRSLFTEDVPKENTAEHGATNERLRSFLDAARQGRLIDQLGDPEAPFYVLGLSPNASRLNVRFWLTGTVQDFAKRLAEHTANLEMTGARPDDPPLAIRRLIAETAREPKDIAPQLAGEFARAVLGGLPYPAMILSALVRRIRADSVVNHRRAAIIKAYLIRNCGKEVPVALDKDYPDEAYHLGRLFAAFEYAQSCALGDVNRTIKDGYFGAASASPSRVFPRLTTLHQHHIEKLPTSAEEAKLEKKRTKGFFERLVQEICSHIRQYPTHLSLERQGLFQIAYYHQRQDFFTKKDTSEQETAND